MLAHKHRPTTLPNPQASAKLGMENATDSMLGAVAALAIPQIHPDGQSSLLLGKHTYICALIYELMEHLADQLDGSWVLILPVMVEIDAAMHKSITLGGAATTEHETTMATQADLESVSARERSFCSHTATISDASLLRLQEALCTVSTGYLQQHETIFATRTALEPVRCLSVRCMTDIFQSNVHRMWLSWEAVTSRLSAVATDNSPGVRVTGVGGLINVVVCAFEKLDAPSAPSEQERVRASTACPVPVAHLPHSHTDGSMLSRQGFGLQVLAPLGALSQSAHDETKSSVLDCAFNILQVQAPIATLCCRPPGRSRRRQLTAPCAVGGAQARRRLAFNHVVDPELYRRAD